MNKDIFARSIGLLGEDNFNKLQDKVIAVFGLGGVGGTALEALARTGFQHFIIIDFDKIDASNVSQIIRNETGKVFVRVLEDSGVFKRTEKGKSAFMRFIEEI